MESMAASHLIVEKKKQPSTAKTIHLASIEL